MVEIALISSLDLTRCIGSTRYSICHHGLATEGLWSSCLSLLFFGNLVQAMKFCDFRPDALPVSERALNLKLEFGSSFLLRLTLSFVSQTLTTLRTSPQMSTRAAVYAFSHSPVAAKFVDLMCTFGLISKRVLRCRLLKSMSIFRLHWPTFSVPCRLWTNCHHTTPNRLLIWIFSEP